jgi:hypothetical protein
VRSPALLPLRACVVVASLAFAGCPSTAQPKAASAHPVGTWVGAEATLFDDGIDVGAVPISSDVAPPRDEQSDAMIGPRVRKADGVVVAKVIGVSREPVGEKTRFVVELAPEGEPLAGKAPGGSLVLRIGVESPAFGTIRAREQELVGRKLVVYYRRYDGSEGDEGIVHFHLSPAIPALLDDVRKQKPDDNGP